MHWVLDTGIPMNEAVTEVRAAPNSADGMRTGLIQSNQPIDYTISRHIQQSSSKSVTALFDCVSTYSLTRLTVWAKKRVHHGEETNRRQQRMRYLLL
jgi:hypothetical protein